MLNTSLITQRLSHYASLWLGAFGLTLAGGLIASFGLHRDLVGVADMCLPLAFGLLTLAVAVSLVLAAVSNQSLRSKIAVILLGIALYLPLLWAPVLAVLICAQMDHSVIEYSVA